MVIAVIVHEIVHVILNHLDRVEGGMNYELEAEAHETARAWGFGFEVDKFFEYQKKLRKEREENGSF